MRKNRLYIFPAFIPLVEILPWLLAAVGGLAGIVQYFREKMQPRHRKILLTVTLLCLATAAGIVLWQRHINPSREQGTQMTAPEKLPALKMVGSAPLPVRVLVPEEHAVFTPLWVRDTETETLSVPIVTHGLYMVGTFGDTVEARDVATGAPVWTLQKKEPVFSGFTVAGDTAFVGEGLHTAINSALTAYSLPDGKPIWQREFLGHLESAPAVDENKGRLWISSGPGGLWALDIKDGDVLWHKKIGHTDCTPLLVKGALYAAAQPDEEFKETILYKMDYGDGKTDWTLKLPGGSMGSPTIGQDLSQVLLTTAIGQVGPPQPSDKGWAHAVNRLGTLEWTVELPGMPLPESSVVRRANLVVITMKSGNLVALDLKDGSKRWEAKVTDKIYAAAGLVEKTSPPMIVVMATDGTVSFLNALDGRELHRLFVGQGGYASPYYANGVLYITAPRKIYAYGGLQQLAGRAE